MHISFLYTPVSPNNPRLAFCLSVAFAQENKVRFGKEKTQEFSGIIAV